jgi:hypothetical protein
MPAAHVSVVGPAVLRASDVVSRIGPGDVLRLRPVDDNPHDPDAVEVWSDGPSPVRIGFVARAEAPRCRNVPRGAGAWRLRVTGRTASVLCGRLEAVPEPGADKVETVEVVDLFSQSDEPEASS